MGWLKIKDGDLGTYELTILYNDDLLVFRIVNSLPAGFICW